MQASWLTQFLSNNLHNRNTMYASWLTQFLFVTLNVSLTVLFVVVNRDFLEAKSAVNNKWTKLSPCGNFVISIVRIWAETNQNYHKDNLCPTIIEFLRHKQPGDSQCRMERPVGLGEVWHLSMVGPLEIIIWALTKYLFHIN